jgi:hypothetical protein
MAQYAHRIHRYTVSGTCYGAAEIWSTSFYVGHVSTDMGTVVQAVVDNVRTAWTTFFTSSDVKFSNKWQTTQIKCAQILEDGSTNLSNVVYAPYGTAISGNEAFNAFPPQVTLAATLENAGARGIASKGRMYLPGIAQPLQANGTLAAADALKVANGFKTFLDAVNVAVSGDGRVILASQGRRVKNAQGEYEPVPGTAVNANVNRVRVGSVYDTQRRRRNDLVEVYQTATLT